MNHRTNSFPCLRSLTDLSIRIAVIVLPAICAYSQTQPGADADRNISLHTVTPCTVETRGEVTYLVKNGVELKVNEDWDCDGVADAYDNCVGMPNSTQTDSDGNRIGDACEAATIIKAGVAAKSRSNTKAKSRRTIARAKSRSNTKSDAPSKKRANFKATSRKG